MNDRRLVHCGAPALPAADELDLPPHAHLPGLNARHDESVFADAKAALPDAVDDAGAATNLPWAYGLRLLNEGFCWEAHEVLEGVWLRAAPNSCERHLVQAVIQLANGELKRVLGKPRAAARLGALALEATGRAFPAARHEPLMGLMRDQVERAGRRLVDGQPCLVAPDRLGLRFER